MTCNLYIKVYTKYTMIKNISNKDKKVFAFIRNEIVHRDKSPSLRRINDITGDKSPRSASLAINRLIQAGLIEKKGREIILANTQPTHSSSISTVDVPLVGDISCGVPIFAEENIQTQIPVSTQLARKGFEYFLLRATGNSMNLAGIKNGDLLLIRQQETAEDGDKIVALINDEATVKIFERTRDAVILRPKSTNKTHKPIILTENCTIQGVVVAVLPSDIY